MISPVYQADILIYVLWKIRKKMAELDAIHAPIRTQEQRHELIDLPRSLANLEARIQEVAQELGNAELLNARRGEGVFLF